jgi:lysozyme family protein
MDDRVTRIIDHILSSEGGYVDDPHDRGGETKYGISHRAYPKLDISRLTIDQARRIYYHDYWVANKCHMLPVDVGIALFDSCVNQGPSWSVKCLQSIAGVTADGIVGKHTIDACSAPGVCDRFLAARIERYRSLPSYSRFGKGWEARVDRLRDFIKEMRDGKE